MTNHMHLMRSQPSFVRNSSGSNLSRMFDLPNDCNFEQYKVNLQKFTPAKRIVVAQDKIGEYLVDSSIHQANYLLRFKNIVDDLKKEEGNLRLIHDRVQHEVEGAKRNTEEIEKDVEKWLMDVQNVLEEIQRLEEDIHVKKTFLCGQCTNWRWRCKVSRRAVGKRNEMAKLRESGNFSRVSHSTTLPGVEGPKDFISFKPTEYAFSRIMEALKSDKINMVGL
ncbi:hypothetical protein LWI29_004616 [Acer saccharum]|uniref:Uncharacterized protein n=1 Tax=Acer saccharum TaxID=4024 RepID=A0AA39SUC7_ACESA|nr:hypothetical protein LWI29_004616 [Acer saccharum]